MPQVFTEANHSNGLKDAGLVVIDMQKDFIIGGLAVPGAAELQPEHHSHVPGLNARNTHTNMIENVMELLALDWPTVVVTEDKHPKGHISFASSHPHNTHPVVPMKWNNENGKKAILCQVGDDSYWAANKKAYKEVYKNKMVDKCAAHKYSAKLNAKPCFVEHNQVLWPDHCIVGTTGDQTHLGIITHKKGRDTYVVQKGMNPVVDSYSAIANNIEIPQFEGQVLDVGPFSITPTQPAKTWNDILKRVNHVYVVGLAADFCVESTALHALNLMGKTTYIIEEATLGVWLNMAKNGPEKDLTKRGKAKIAFEDAVKKKGINLVSMEQVRQKAGIVPGNMLEIGAKADFS